MKEIVVFNDKFKKIDKDYFSNYGGNDYSKNYLRFTSNPKDIIVDLIYQGISFETLLDVGCASGELVRDFRRLGIDAYGIENNKQILKKSVSPKHCFYGDMFDLSNIGDGEYDIIYTNSLMYAFPNKVVGILSEFHRIANKAVYMCCPFLEETPDLVNDPYRVFLAKKSWWKKQFKEANFKVISDCIYAC